MENVNGHCYLYFNINYYFEILQSHTFCCLAMSLLILVSNAMLCQYAFTLQRVKCSSRGHKMYIK